jgi:hypothetical protein
MISGFAEQIIARAIREGVVLYPGTDGRKIHYQAYGRPLAPDLRALLLEHKPAILSVLSAGGIQSLGWGLAPAAPLLVDGVMVVVCETYPEAAALIAEMIQDAEGKPAALDLETCTIPSERERLAALTAERSSINAEAIAYRKAAKKAGTPQAEIDAFTAGANAKLKVLDAKIEYCESSGLDPWRAEIRLIQLYGGGPRAAVVDISKAGAEALELLQGVTAVIHNAPFDLAFLDRFGITLGKVHDTQQAARRSEFPSAVSPRRPNTIARSISPRTCRRAIGLSRPQAKSRSGTLRATSFGCGVFASRCFKISAPRSQPTRSRPPRRRRSPE